jgi:hypothetical protein
MMQLSDGLITARIGVRMNSLELTAHKAYKAHSTACEVWNNGEIAETWLDDNHVLCIRYKNGSWWHYDMNKDGEWIWW